VLVPPLPVAALLATFVLIFTAAVTRAGTIRDDRDPALYTALANDPGFKSVGLLEVSVFEQGVPAVGSATLIAPDWVLTAAHVVEGGRAINFNVAGQAISARRWVSHPKYNGNLITGFDLALVQLNQPVPDVTPSQIYRKKREKGAEGIFVGFGRTGNGVTGDITDDRVKRAGTNIIDGRMKRNNRGFLEVIPKLGARNRTFAVDFDSPSNPLESRMGDSVPTDLELLISRGDSGGPVFIDDPNDLSGPLVAGVHSFGEIFDERDDSDYGDLTGHTRVSTYAGWIDKTITRDGFQRKLNFITPTTTIPAAVFDPSARSIGPVDVPEPTGLAALAVGGILLMRRRRHATS